MTRSVARRAWVKAAGRTPELIVVRAGVGRRRRDMNRAAIAAPPGAGHAVEEVLS